MRVYKLFWKRDDPPGKGLRPAPLAHTPIAVFMPALDLRAWASVSNEALRQILHRIDRPQPSHFTPLLLAGQRIGWLAPGHVQPLCKHLAYCKNHGQAVVWEAADLSVQARSQLLAEAAQKLREQAHIHGWRDELYSYWGEIDRDPDPQLPERFRLERSVFRFLGLRSHAVHINGFRPDGRIWCGIRALSKATDPGRIDNLAAGGLPAGETVMACAIRELHEEAGLPESIAHQIQPAGRVLTRRQEKEGWHDETLLVYNLILPEEVEPRNLDGEVSGFVCLDPNQAMQQIEQMTEDAAGVLAQGLLFLRAHAP